MNGKATEMLLFFCLLVFISIKLCDMKRKIHISEAQLKEIVKKINESSDEVINFNQDSYDNMPLQSQAQVAVNAKNDGQDREVNFYGNPVQQGTNPVDLVKNAQAGAKEIMGNGLMEGNSITKRQIKEARLNKLVKNSIGLIKKKNLK